MHLHYTRSLSCLVGVEVQQTLAGAVNLDCERPCVNMLMGRVSQAFRTHTPPVGLTANQDLRRKLDFTKILSFALTPPKSEVSTSAVCGFSSSP